MSKKCAGHHYALWGPCGLAFIGLVVQHKERDIYDTNGLKLTKKCGIIFLRKMIQKILMARIFLVSLRWILIIITAFPSSTGCLFFCSWWTYCNIGARGIQIMLQFPHAFFTVVLECIPWRSLFVASLPSSLYLLKKFLGLHKHHFQKFVVCPKCNSLYNYDSAFERVGSRRVSKKRLFVDFPNHRHRAYRKPCNEVLSKEIKCQDGKVKVYPKSVYCY